jgi:hypothetical protein
MVVLIALLGVSMLLPLIHVHSPKQITKTFVTLALALPLPLVTVQFWLVGWVSTVTLYAVLLATGFEKVKPPFAPTGRLLPSLTCKTSPVPMSRETVPPIV